MWKNNTLPCLNITLSIQIFKHHVQSIFIMNLRLIPMKSPHNRHPSSMATDLLLHYPFYQPKKSVHTSNLTPFICRDGCKHYDGVKDEKGDIFTEFCCYGRSYLIKESSSRNHFEDKNPVYDDEDGILRF